ncbi:hypothetical protein [Tsukamurella sp. PLM1]|uniref:hypothetical protein n=1 Tax=Tsukamurella sp. PLM1 TaxID=2929795 RepID=UPI0020C11C78|nr:hypothetical protein [Tsukamurella sp. PLM1]
MTAPGIARAAAYDISGVVPGTHLAVPSPTLTMIIDLGHGLDLTGPGLPDRTTFRLCISGMHPTPYLVHHDGLQRGVQVDVKPSLVRALTGAPAAELGGEAVELGALHSGLAGELYGRVAAAPVANREAVAAEVLAAYATSGREVQPDAAAAWSYSRRDRGGSPSPSSSSGPAGRRGTWR